MDFITGGCDVALPGKPFRGRMLIDGAWVEAAVWSRNIDICLTAARRMKAGTIGLNSFMGGYPELPAAMAKAGSVANSVGRRWKITPRPRQSGCTSHRVPDGGCHDNLAHSNHLQVAERQLSGRIRAFIQY